MERSWESHNVLNELQVEATLAYDEHTPGV